MARVRFGDVVKEVKINIDRKTDDHEFFIAGEHMESENIHITKRGRFADSDVGPAFIRLFKPGQILYGSRRTYLKKVAVADFEGITSNTTFVLETKDPNIMLQELLPFIMLTDNFTAYAVKNSKGSTNPYILFSDLAAYEFELPDIEEQKRLTAKLLACDRAKEAYKKQIQATDDLVKSQFIEMFYGREYPMRTIGQVVDRTVLRASKKFAKDDIIEYLDISSIDNSSKTVTGTTTYTLSEAPSRAQYVLQKDDILYSTVRPNLQNIAVNPYSANNIIGSTGFCVLRCREVSKGFMWGLITSDQFTDKMVSLASGANYPAVTDKVVYEFEFPMPPYEEQMRFERIVEQSDKSKFELQQAIEKVDNLIKSLIQQDNN